MTTAESREERLAPGGPVTIPPFAVISGAQVEQVLHDREPEIVDLVAAAYRLHGVGQSVNPRSSFLRLPDRPASRIIALPASIGGPLAADGIKWISSFPANVTAGIPRASAVLILNEHTTGYPIACLEASIISAARTAGSAVLAADQLTRSRPCPTRIGFVGTGLIARYIHTYLVRTGWSFGRIGLHDLSPSSAHGFAGYLARSGTAASVTVHADLEHLIRDSDLVVFATVATRPYVRTPAWFDHNPVILHISLRDLAPQILLRAVNIVDDVEHCLQADTSPHLVEQATGSRNFIAGTLADVLEGRLEPPADRPVVFSPFGLGILDVIVGRYVYDQLCAAGELRIVGDFFHEVRRHG